MEAGERNIEDVDRILSFAKLDRQDFQSPVQCVSFVTDLDNDGIKLIELDKSALHLLQAGQQLIVRGHKTDSAVLCTKNKTFKVLEQDTSDALLISPDILLPDKLSNETEPLVHKQVIAVKHEYFELREIPPRLKRLQNLLEENQYSGPECEEDEEHQGNKYTYDELLDQVQASEGELFQALQDLQACLIEGCWRMLEFDFVSKVLNSILNLKEENSWSLDEIPLKECCETLSDLYPQNVTKHVLECFSEPVAETAENSMKTDNTDKHKLCEDRVCRFFAEMLLKPVEKFNFKEFMEVWQLAVPEGMSTGLYQLEGMTLVDRDSKPGVIRYFPASQLPEDVAERFDSLFSTKAKWTRDEIMPYVKNLASDEAGVVTLLSKYSRTSMQNGIKVHSSKKQVS